MSAPGDFDLCQRVDLCEINKYSTWYYQVQWTINYDLNTKWMQKYTFIVLEIDFTWLVVPRSCFYSSFVNSLQSTNLTTHSMNSTSIIFAISGPRSQFPRPTATWSRRRSLENVFHICILLGAIPSLSCLQWCTSSGTSTTPSPSLHIPLSYYWHYTMIPLLLFVSVYITTTLSSPSTSLECRRRKCPKWWSHDKQMEWSRRNPWS